MQMGRHKDGPLKFLPLLFSAEIGAQNTHLAEKKSCKYMNLIGIEFRLSLWLLVG